MSHQIVSDDELRAAVSKANIPILLMVLVQLTGDHRWLEGPYKPSRTIGMDDNDEAGFSPELQGEVRAAAADAIVKWRHDGKVAIPLPDDELIVEMLSVCMGERIPAELGPRMAETLKASIDPKSTAFAPIPVPKDFKVAIIGAGFSGLTMAARLTEAGVPFVILEKETDLGGVWWSNHYPGAGVDTPSYLYSLSFAPYPWKRYYADRDQVHEYLHHIANQFRLKPHIRLGTEVETATFDEASQTWTLSVRDADGGQDTIRANVVVCGVGIFNPPITPTITGRSTFKGPAFHTAEWPQAGVELKGKRVAVVGNGASAMQTAPAIAPDVASLAIFQRSPHWIAPFSKFQKDIPDDVALLLREVPIYRAWFRERQGWIFGDRNYRSLYKDPAWPTPQRSLNKQNESHRRFYENYIREKLGDREDLVAKCTPPFPPYAKRMLLDNGWYDTLRRGNVTLEADSIAKIVPEGIVTSSGKTYELDVIIFATGFGVTQFISTFEVVGKGGLSLRALWGDDDAKAYLGMTVPAFPNFFMMYGPNVNGGGGSILGHLEAQVRYIVEMVREMAAAGVASVDCAPDVYEQYVERVDETHAKLIYTHDGVKTYYKNSRGRVVAQNPFSNAEYWRLTREPALSDYRVVTRRVRDEVAAS